MSLFFPLSPICVMAWNVFRFYIALRGLGSIMILLVLGVMVVSYYAVVLTKFGPALYSADIGSISSVVVKIMMFC